MDETEGSSRGELGPIARSTQPIQVFSKESVRSRTAMGKGVGECDGRVVDRISVFEGIFGDFEDRHVGLVVLVEEI